MPTGIYLRTKHWKLSNETKRKLSLIHKGRKNSQEHNRNISKGHIGINTWSKGKKQSIKTRKKISLSTKGKNTWSRGSKKSSQTRIKMSQPRSEEHKKHISESHKGEKSHFWKGGISFEKYGLDWTDDLRESIRKRDNYICQECEIHQDEFKGRRKKLSVHHIDYDKYNLDPNNLISLCQSCHQKTNFDRDYWINYFKK